MKLLIITLTIGELKLVDYYHYFVYISSVRFFITVFYYKLMESLYIFFIFFMYLDIVLQVMVHFCVQTH